MKKCNKTQHGLTKETPRYFHHTDITQLSISLNKKQCHTSYLLAGKVFDMMLYDKLLAHWKKMETMNGLQS